MNYYYRQNDLYPDCLHLDFPNQHFLSLHFLNQDFLCLCSLTPDFQFRLIVHHLDHLFLNRLIKLPAAFPFVYYGYDSLFHFPIKCQK